VRDDVLKSLEEARTEKIIGNSLEAKVTIEANDEEVKEVLSNIKDIHQLFIVSEAVINESHPDAKEYKYTKVHVEKHQGDKCNRYRTLSETVGLHVELLALISRNIVIFVDILYIFTILHDKQI